MATLVNDSYSCASGGFIAAGRHVLPAWLSAIPVGQWSSLSGTALSASGVIHTWPGSVPGTPAYIVDAWGGWAKVGTDIYLQGGGHGDYAGNEIYKISLASNTLAWSLDCAPTPYDNIVRYVNGGNQNYSRWNEDGKPVAAHIYWSAQYLKGKIYRTTYFDDFGKTLAGTLSFAPNNEPYLPSYDVASKAWDAPDANAVIPGWSISNPTGGAIAWSPCCTDGDYYYAVLNDQSTGSTNLYKYDPATDAWSSVGSAISNPGWDSGVYPGSVYDSSRHELVLIGEKTQKIVRRYNLSTGVKIDTTRTGVDFGGSWDSSYSGVAYDSKRDLYYLYSGQAAKDKNLYVIDPSGGYAVSIMSGTGTPSETVPTAGLNSRFAYIAGLDILIFQATYTSNLVVLRLS